jgi:pyruvate dehydrogenase E1 component alpha subunit
MGISLEELKSSTGASRLNGHASIHALEKSEEATTDELVQFLSVEGELLPGREAPLPDAEVRRLYLAMARIRLIDERMTMLQRQGRIGFYIGGTGEEAAIIGPIAALRVSDWLFPCYRENGGYLLRGMPLQRFVDNLFGNANDPALGRQMPNHISWRQSNIASVSSPIGTQMPHAAGAAYAAKLLGKDDVMMTYFGEGGTSSNDFHTGMNFAGVWKAPDIFVCRNNHWAISIPREKQCAAVHFADKAAGYGMPGIRVDGNDLFAMYAVTRDAIARARRGEGPTFIEAVTYRITGHSTSDDPSVYRTPAQVDPWRPKDPLIRLRKYLAAKGLWGDGDEEALKVQVDEECKAAVKAAESAAAPVLESLFADVYAELPWHLQEQQAEMLAGQGGQTAPKGEFPL